MQMKHFRVSPRSLALFASLALGSGLVVAQFSIGPGPSAAPAKNAASASASTWTPQQLADFFRKADADGDGRISRQEASRSKGLASNFDNADTDRDGVLSRAEFDQSIQ
ncbi:MAG: calcium-binding protein [Ramlibacter sp.]|jgi:Ca2+-binding EF-hand superfamily protein|nr:calcium-binding protein [Ramlibacter sp.]